MKIYSFKNDYSEGCHPKILEMLLKSNLEQLEGYGEDRYSIKAKEFIKRELNDMRPEIHFVCGGTQANLIVISSVLKPYESVISANSGHINIHEAGAIEATGHKINSVDSDDGKLSIKDLQRVLDEHNEAPHVVKPKMVYISNSTELGTIYDKDELYRLYSFCKEKNLYLFLDGARLGSAICAKNSDLRLSDIVKYTDIFYIGGTKNGAMLSEAIVINNEKLKEDFAYVIKQRGGLLSKGRMLGMQFYTLFEDNLFYELATYANKMAQKICVSLQNRGIKFLTNSATNQVFPILPNRVIKNLKKRYGFYVWKKIGEDRSAVRIVTSWATKESKVDDFIKDILCQI